MCLCSHLLVPLCPVTEVQSVPVTFYRVGAWLMPTESVFPEILRKVWNSGTDPSY